MEAIASTPTWMERALYNTVLGGMALDGKHFFYVNPLEVHPKSLKFNHIYDHVKPIRQRWFGCACLPAEHRPRAHLPWSLHLHAACGCAVHQYVRG
ncbi:glycosyl hydrolase [Salmonella enterica subsp. enterica]|nr:glycosyl hydrolase [Salmonella enterica subsp. enterica]